MKKFINQLPRTNFESLDRLLCTYKKNLSHLNVNDLSGEQLTALQIFNSQLLLLVATINRLESINPMESVSYMQEILAVEQGVGLRNLEGKPQILQPELHSKPSKHSLSIAQDIFSSEILVVRELGLIMEQILVLVAMYVGVVIDK